jgi:hypothetical protein
LRELPDLVEAHHRIGVYSHLQGDFDSARHHYAAARRLDPNDYLIARNLDKLERDSSSGGASERSAAERQRRPQQQPRQQRLAVVRARKVGSCGGVMEMASDGTALRNGSTSIRSISSSSSHERTREAADSISGSRCRRRFPVSTTSSSTLRIFSLRDTDQLKV